MWLCVRETKWIEWKQSNSQSCVCIRGQSRGKLEHPVEGSSHSLSLHEFRSLRTATHHHLLHVVGSTAMEALHLRCACLGSGATCTGIVCANAGWSICGAMIMWAYKTEFGGVSARKIRLLAHLVAFWRGGLRHRRHTPPLRPCRASCLRHSRLSRCTKTILVRDLHEKRNTPKLEVHTGKLECNFSRLFCIKLLALPVIRTNRIPSQIMVSVY